MIDQKFYQSLFLDNLDIPDIFVESVNIFHHTVVIKTKNAVGISTILNDGIVPPPTGFGTLHKRTLKELSKLYISENYLEAAIGMAAINCAINLTPKASKELFNGYDFIKKRGENRNVAVIGRFPFIKRLRPNLNVKNLWVFELDPLEEELGPSSYEEFLPQADLVIITATTLVNKSFHKLYPHLKDSFNVLTGPTTPLTEMLFDYKIDALSGVIVTNYQDAYLSFSQGASSRHALGLKKITLTK